jgi:hypothetical protein
MPVSRFIAGTPRDADARGEREAVSEPKRLDPNHCTCQASYLPHRHLNEGIVDVVPVGQTNRILAR